MPNSAPSPSVPASAADAVFDSLLTSVVGGIYPPGARLPAERDLARDLGASRPTVREALSRLSAWGVVESRRGSGITVCERIEWSIEVLPAYLRHHRFRPGDPGIARLVVDMLDLRRLLVGDMILLVAERMPAGGTAPARAAVDTAWALRRDGAAFGAADFQVTRRLLDAADLLPALWTLNSIAGVYLDLASSLGGAIVAPADYVETHETVFRALEEHDGQRARRLFNEYLERHDSRLLGALKALS